MEQIEQNSNNFKGKYNFLSNLSKKNSETAEKKQDTTNLNKTIKNIENNLIE